MPRHRKFVKTPVRMGVRGATLVAGEADVSGASSGGKSGGRIESGVGTLDCPGGGIGRHARLRIGPASRRKLLPFQ